MPTGYTAGILDGEIKTFEQFAKLCVRNFGATIHMRDDSMDAEYKPRVPSTYHAERIAQATNLLSKSSLLTDEEVIAIHTKELNDTKNYHLQALEKSKSGRESLNRILDGVKQYTPPTEEHKGIKTFMIEQITSTITHDCDISYYADKVQKIDQELETMTAESIRKSMAETAIKDLKYHEEEYRKDVVRCNESNEWVN